MDNFQTDEEKVFKNFQEMIVNDEDVNILLLGETGVGKSTFINSFANYLEYDQFNRAENAKVRCCIPAKFAVSDDKLEEQIVEIGSDNNENSSIFQSATQETRSYVFPVKKRGVNRVRLIDTPGIGDVGGIDKDNENMENILSYISHLENLHAICFLLKPNNARLTVMFHYCIKQLLSRLEKSASKNIIFLFTNTRSTFYKPGDTTTALKKILEDIRSRPPNVDIKYTKDNVFCLDNESFRYLVAIRSGIELGNKESFAQSWTHSVTECWRMIDFITGKGNSTVKIVPHKVKDTISVNEARRTILQLSQPLADIADLINDNINALDRHNKALQTDNMSIADLKQNLYVPVVNLRCKELSQPTTICAATKCCEVYEVAGVNKYHYKQRCHDPCYLQNVPKEIIGSPELVNCWAMSQGKCRICQCNFTSHMHVYYLSETYEDKMDNEGVKAQIKDRETALNETKKIITKIENVKQTYENEKDTIIKTMAKFAHFLQRNAIAPYNDGYKGYIEYLIDREKSQGAQCNSNTIKYYQELLKRYDEEKMVLDQALSSSSKSTASTVTARTVFDAVQTLFRLPNIGKKIKELCTRQMTAQKSEHKNTEMVLEDVNQGVRQRKIEQNKQKGKPNNKNQHSQNQNDRGKMGINQNDKPYMKAKDKRPDNDRGRNNFNNRGRQSIPDLRYINSRSHFPQNQYNSPMPPQHMQYQYGAYGHQNAFPQQGYVGPQYPPPPNFSNYQQPPQHLGNPQFFHVPPMFQQQYSNYQTQPQQGHYFPAKASFTSSNPDLTNNRQNDKNSTASDSPVDPDFRDWFLKLTANSGPKKNDNTTKYNTRSKKYVPEDSSDDSDHVPKGNSDSDDEDFKEFMREKGLEYLVKESSNTSAKANKKTNTNQKNKNNNNFPNQPRNYRRQDDSDSDDDNNSKAKSKGFFSNLLNEIF